MEVKSSDATNRLVSDPSLAAQNLKAYIPSYKTMGTGIIRDVAQDIKIEELMNDIVPPQAKILEITRLNR